MPPAEAAYKKFPRKAYKSPLKRVDLMQWQVRQVDLPVRFGVYSLEWAVSKKKDFDYVAGLERVQQLLEKTKGLTDNETLKDKLDDIKDIVDELKEGLDDESPLESYLTSFSPEKKGILVSVSAILKRDKQKQKTDNRSLRDLPYFVQILRAHNQRQIFGEDVSCYSYVAKPFSEKDQLVQLVNSAQIPDKYQEPVIAAFEEVLGGEQKRTGKFTIPTQERYHPFVSRLVAPVKYVTASGGAVVGVTGGVAVGAGLGALVGGMGILVGGMGLLVGGMGLLVAGLGSVAGGAYGISKGAELGYKLQDRFTGNHPQITS